MMAAIRKLGRLPRRRMQPAGEEEIKENALARKLEKTRKKLSKEQEAELAELTRLAMQPLTELDAPPDPMDPFADEASNRLEQDVLMAANGMRSRDVMRRIARYKKYMTEPAALEADVVQKYKD